MEGVPRLPMLKVEMKDNHDYSNMDWMDASAESMREELQEQITEQIRKHISENYSDDPQKYDDCINKFLELQTSAYKVIGNPDFEGSNTLKKYYGQLHYMQSRFKFTGENSLNCPFVWLDAFTGAYSQHNTFVFEQASIIFNLGACHSFLGAVDNRTSEEGTKVSCVHFQCAAGFFQFLADRLDTTLSPDTSQFMLKLFINTMLGQGQECFLEKSMQDNRKDSIVAKISQEVVDYYKQVNISLNNAEAKSCMGDSANKYWSKLISLKISYYSAITKFYMGSSSWEQEKYGEGVAFLASALDCYQEAVKACKSLKSDTRNQVEDALKYIADVIGGKYNSVKKDNEFVYHDKVPDKATLPEVKGASLVKALPFDPSNSAVTGPDIFSKLVPMEAHLAASSYSEEKAQLLRTVLADVEEKEIVLQQFKQAIELDPDKLIQVEEEDRLDSILVENCASLSVDQTPIKELTKAMKELSDRFMDIDSMLHDTRDLIEEEESQSQKIKDICGKTIESPEQVEDIKTELEMCQEVHSKAGTMNESLHIAMKIHISNLKIVSEGLDAVKKHCEIKKTMSLLNDNDYEDISLVKKLCSKVKEMEDQRQSLVNQLRSQLEEDDVTSALMTKHGMEAEELFKDELKKHDSMVEYIRLNLEAQEKILNGVTEVNVRYNKIRKVIDEHKQKVNLKTQQLLISCTEYKEAVRRCKDGTDFFKELLGKVSEANEKMNKIHDKNTKLRKKLLEKFEANKAPPRPVAPKPKPTQAGAAVPQIPAIPGVGLSAAELSELSAGMDDDFNDPAFLRYLQMTGGLPGGGPLPSVPKVPNPTPATEARPQPRIPTLPPTARSVHQVIPVSQPHPTSNPTDMNPRNFATPSPQSSYQMPPLSNAQAHPQPYMGPSQRNVPPDGDYTSNPPAALSPAYSDPGVNMTDPPRARYAPSQQQLPQRQPTSHPNMNYTSLSGAPKTAPSHQPHVEYTAAGQQQYGQVQTNQVPAYSLQQQQQPHPSSFVVQPPTHVQQGTNIASDSRTNQQHQPVYSHHRHQHVPANYAQVPHNNQPQPSMSPQVQQNYAPLPPTSQYAQQTSGNITTAPHQVSNYNIAANNNPQNLYQQNQQQHQQHQLPHQQNQQHQHQNPLHQQQNQLHQHQPQNQQHQQQNQLHQQQHQQRASQFVQTPKLPQQAAVSLQSAFHQPNLPQTQSTFTGQPIAQDPRKNVQASNIAYQAEHLASNQNAKVYQPLPSQTQISRTQLQFPQQAQLHQQQQQQLPIQQMQQNQPRPLLSQPQIQQQQQKQFHPQIHQQQQQQQQFRPQIQQQQQQQQQQFRPQIPPQHVNHPQQQPRQQILQPQHRQLQQPQGQQPQMQVLPNQTQHPVGSSNSYNNPQHAETRNAPLPDARPTYQNNVPKQNPPQGNIPVPRFSNPTAASAQPQRQMLSPTHVEPPYQTQQSATISQSLVYQQTSQALLPSSRPHQPQQAVHQPQQHPTAAHQQPHHNVKPPHTPSTNQATEAQLPQTLLQPTRAIAPQTNQRESGSSKVPGASVPIRPSADLAGLTYTPAETLRPTRASTSADELLSASPDNNIGEEVPAPKLMLVPEIVDSQEDAMVVRRYDGIPYKSEADLMQFKSDTEAFHQKVSSLLIKVPGALCQLDKDWKQLSELQEKHARSLSTAVGRCSSYKNRFQDILPFDQTRVVLGESKDDYINASLVDGISPYCPRFIATQSPLPSSISDFWTMIHEQQVTIIVMLVSKNVDTKKCAKYWPEDRNVSQRHGPISVTFTTSRFHDTYIERTFTLKHNKSSLPRSLTQLQYTAWPEHGLPASTRDLLSFMRVVGSFHTQQRNLQWPVVVHCEDGVSHSGTFCTSIACVQELDADQGIPDILAVVETIRKRRKFMLQEKAQLKFVHDLVLKHAIDLLKERGVEIEVKSTQSNTPQQQVSVSPNHRRDGANFDVFGSGKLSTIRANVDKMTIRPNDKIPAATPNTSKITESALAPSPGPAAPHSPAVLVDITTLIGSNVSDLVQGTIVGVDGSKQTHSAPVAISVRPDLVSSCNDNADEVKQVAAERGSVHQTDVAPTPALPPQQQGGQQMHLQSAEQPPSFLDKLTPESFTLGTEVKEKQRITKADFLKPRGLSLGVGQNSEQGDPFGDLDPLWGLKK